MILGSPAQWRQRLSCVTMKHLQESIKQMGARVESVLDCDLKDRVLRLLSIEDQILASIELTGGPSCSAPPGRSFFRTSVRFCRDRKRSIPIHHHTPHRQNSSPQGHEHHRRSRPSSHSPSVVVRSRKKPCA